MPPLLGQLVLFPYNVPPLGWMLCDGSLISIAEDEPLFQLLGGFASKSELIALSPLTLQRKRRPVIRRRPSLVVHE